jgi:hypothetical protein
MQKESNSESVTAQQTSDTPVGNTSNESTSGSDTAEDDLPF